MTTRPDSPFRRRKETTGSFLPKAVPPAEILYAHDGTAVTFHWLYADGVRFTIAGLSDITKTKSSAIGGVLSAIAVAGAGLIAALVFSLHSDPAAALLAVAAALPALITAPILARNHTTQYSLHARYRGSDMVLFATRDVRQFGQVARAIQRAIEAQPRRLP